jgi:hypothetical protein
MCGTYRMRSFIAVFVTTILCAGLFVQGAAAQTPNAKCDPSNMDPKVVSCKQTASITTLDASKNPQTVTKQVAVTTAYGTTPWEGLNWGIGIATNFDLSGKRVKAAQIDSANIVRVTESGNVGVSFVLEAHYFLKEWFPFKGCQALNCTDYAAGPFVAIEIGGGTTSAPSPASSNNPITGYALGLMLGMHHPTADAADSKLANSSWNFGVGLRVDPSAQVLADGVVANRPPPAGITTADQLFKKEPRRDNASLVIQLLIAEKGGEPPRFVTLPSVDDPIAEPRFAAICGLAQSARSSHKDARYQRIRARSSVGRARDF